MSYYVFPKPEILNTQVADISDVVRQRADALMLSGESAVGAYPEKALGVLRQVSTRIEEWCRCAAALGSALGRGVSRGSSLLMNKRP